MTFKAPVKSGVKRELIPEDSYHAICYALFDLGTHENEFQGKVWDQRKVVLIWEIPSLRIKYEKDGEELEGPKVISKQYTWSMHEKANLRKDMETWRGKSFTDLEAADFDFEQIPGANGIIQVMHKEKKNGDKYAFIGSITKLMKGMDKLEPENPKSFFSFYAPYVDEVGFHFPESMPEWVKDTIKESREYSAIIDVASDFAEMQADEGTGTEEQQAQEEQAMQEQNELDVPF